MKIKLRAEQCFTIDVAGKPQRFFAAGPQWNGMTELKNEKGEKLIVSFEANAFSVIFARVLHGATDEEAVVVSASPSLWDALRRQSAATDEVKAAA